MNTERKDVYSRITSQIIASLEQGVRPWIKPWNAEHAAGRITRPLRHNGQPYSGINVLALWASATVQNFSAPIWVTYRQATELGAHVRQGEKGSLVVYANSITRTEHDDETGEDTAHRANVTTSKSYNTQSDFRFDFKTFTEMKNAQSVTLAYDGLNPLPPTFMYLKPYFNNVNKSYFRQLADGEL